MPTTNEQCFVRMKKTIHVMVHDMVYIVKKVRNEWARMSFCFFIYRMLPRYLCTREAFVCITTSIVWYSYCTNCILSAVWKRMFSIFRMGGWLLYIYTMPDYPRGTWGTCLRAPRLGGPRACWMHPWKKWGREEDRKKNEKKREKGKEEKKKEKKRG